MTLIASLLVVSPRFPAPRGPLTEWLRALLIDGAVRADHPIARGDALTDDDLQLALYCCYELSYRGFGAVDARAEWSVDVLRLRLYLETVFEDALRAEAPRRRAYGTNAGDAVAQLIEEFEGPSLSGYMAERGTDTQLLEFLMHRSAYQLKEADPHSLAIPRLNPGRRKSALIEIQADEYGGGVPGRSHAELFSDAMQAAGLDATYGEYLDLLPGVTLATCNLVSLLGFHRRLTPALLGHLAVFEMTSVGPMGRYAQACDRMGMPPAVRHFYDVHVEADDHHGRLARHALLGGEAEHGDIDVDEVLFGAGALMAVESRFSRHLLAAWYEGKSSLSPSAPALAIGSALARGSAGL